MMETEKPATREDKESLVVIKVSRWTLDMKMSLKISRNVLFSVAGRKPNVGTSCRLIQGLRDSLGATCSQGNCSMNSVHTLWRWEWGFLTLETMGLRKGIDIICTTNPRILKPWPPPIFLFWKWQYLQGPGQPAGLGHFAAKQSAQRWQPGHSQPSQLAIYWDLVKILGFQNQAAIPILNFGEAMSSNIFLVCVKLASLPFCGCI